ncbi:uncharacterized protein C1450.15 [Carica papaya]|uniref:uncharacterized protein C1450.15 n=1 Tax=Carica papaya TaxID=3649 RepID=UPI000B8CD0E3|nr:uncharacterized protein C1450.15 [Carica papaya]
MKTSAKDSTHESISAAQAFFVHLSCGLILAAGFWVAHNIYSINLVSHTTLTLRLIWIVAFPVVVLFYSLFRRNPEQCSYWKSVGRGILGLPIGALLNALGAVALGAPVGLQYLPKTINWSLLMSLFTFVPASSVYGSSRADWHHTLIETKPNGSIDYMICLPAYGAIIGAWFGAWPMPLDWERPWQQWPICVTYGAMVGYTVAMVASFYLVLIHHRREREKAE